MWRAGIFPLAKDLPTPLTGPLPHRATTRDSSPSPDTPAFSVILQELQLVVGVGPLHDVHQAKGGTEHLPSFLQDVRRMFQTCCRGMAPGFLSKRAADKLGEKGVCRRGTHTCLDTPCGRLPTRPRGAQKGRGVQVWSGSPPSLDHLPAHTPVCSPESGSTAAPPLRVNFILFSDLLMPWKRTRKENK